MNIIEKITALFDFAIVDKLSELLLIDIGIIDEIAANKIKQQTNHFRKFSFHKRP